MNAETFKRANQLHGDIKQFEEALNCFEWKASPDSPAISTNPVIIVEYDGDESRCRTKLPINLSTVLIAILKDELIKGKIEAQKEFDSL